MYIPLALTSCSYETPWPCVPECFVPGERVISDTVREGRVAAAGGLLLSAPTTGNEITPPK